MIYFSNGRVGYDGWGPTRIPRLVEIYDQYDSPVTVPRTGEGGRYVRDIKLYRLEWPGETDIDIELPGDLVRSRGWNTDDSSERHTWTISELFMDRDDLPQNLDLSLRYHLAINSARYWPDNPLLSSIEVGQGQFSPPSWDATGQPPISVLGLSPGALRFVLSARFAVDHSYIATISHLRWLYQSHRQNPLFGGFDTVIREYLLNVSNTVLDCFFYMISDCYWDRPEGQGVYRSYSACRAWRMLAHYLSLVGRTGYGTMLRQAHVPPDNALVNPYRTYISECRDYHGNTHIGPEDTDQVSEDWGDHLSNHGSEETSLPVTTGDPSMDIRLAIRRSRVEAASSETSADRSEHGSP